MSETRLVLHHACATIQHGKLGAITQIIEAHKCARNVHLSPFLEDILHRQSYQRGGIETNVRELLNIIKVPKLQYHGHIHRNK